ncbi:MAG: methionyl-tRNA formyltransferase [Patescibacteria group bacterium]
MVNSIKIIFFGTPDFAVPALKLLADSGYQIVAVFTQSDKHIGRKQVLSPPPVKFKADNLKLKVFQPKTLKDNQVFEDFKNLNPDICVIAAYGKMIPKRYLDVPARGFVNIHPSLLPKYRGPSPIQTAILNGDKKTGVTIMLVDEEMDHGKILSSIEYRISDDKNYEGIEDDLAGLGAKLLIETLSEYINGNIQLTEQNHEQATYTKLLTREDGRIDWNKSALETYDQIRALNPEPGTWSTWKGKIINIKKAELADGKINIQNIQIEGKKEMAFQEFLNGHPDFTISDLN